MRSMPPSVCSSLRSDPKKGSPKWAAFFPCLKSFPLTFFFLRVIIHRQFERIRNGPVAQLGERSVRIREVESSSLFRSTIQKKSELLPHRERVRISSLYQRYYILSSCPRFCLAHNRGLCIFDETILFRYNHSINQKGDCIWKFSTFALETTIFQI